MIGITPHLPMVKRMARRYKNTPLGHEDAEGIGYLALVEAARSWDPDVGCPFVAYANRCVKFAMVDAVRFRGGKRRAARPEWEVAMDRDETAERFSVEDRANRFLDALTTLRTRVRCVVVLSMWAIRPSISPSTWASARAA